MTSTSYLDCFLNINQEFLVCTTIHRAKNLPSFNIDTFVKVNLDKKSKSTKVFQNSENPYYNELSCTLAELLRLTVLYEVKKKSCKSIVVLGELLIDLHTVWNQPQKCFVKKWGKLESSIGSKIEAQGFLQIDLAIVSSNQSAPTVGISCGQGDDIEGNLLQDLETPCNIRYTICFYSGIFVKKSDYILQVSFAGMSGKTSSSKGSSNPIWNEEVQFNWTFPSLSQKFLIQVISHEHLQWKCVAESEIYFDEISFNAVPCLGPTYIHFYDFNSYVGRILIQIKSEKLNATNESIKRTFLMKPTQPLMEKSWWNNETFLVEFLMWQGEFVHANASNMKVFMKLGECTSDLLECHLHNYKGATAAAVKYFTQCSPFKAIHIKCSLPDNRLKYECDRFLISLVKEMDNQMKNFKLLQLKHSQNELIQGKCLKAIILSILEKIQEPQFGTHFQYNGFKQLTAWDENRLAYLGDFFERLSVSLKDLRQSLKTIRVGENLCDKVLQELHLLKRQIESIIQTRIQDEWPDLQLLMSLGSGKGSTKEFGICKLNAANFVYSQRSECNGHWCGIPRNFIFKDPTCTHTCSNCGCIRGFVYGLIRIATEVEQTEFTVSDNWNQKERFYYQPKIESTDFICRTYIHQAKIQPGADKTGLCDTKLKIMFGEELVETPTIFSSLSPVWNQTVTFGLRKMPGPVSWYENNPPILAVQVFDEDRQKSHEYLGCGFIELVVSKIKELTISVNESDTDGETPSNQRLQSKRPNLKKVIKTKVALQELKKLKHLSPPPLKWIPITNMGAVRIEVLMSGELLFSNNSELKGDKAALTNGIPKDIQPTMNKYLLEVTFVGLRNCKKMCCSSLGRYKIHIMMGELLLKSGISGNKIGNSINFLENFASGVVNLPEQLEYWPAIIATHIDCIGREREVTLGASLISNPSKYVSKRIVLCQFEETNETTVIQLDEDEESTPLIRPQSVPKEHLFIRLKNWFSKMIVQKRKAISQVSKNHNDESDYNWWTKFYNSMNLHFRDDLEESFKHKLIIYESELEKQIEFNFLSDWAESFNLVHGLRIKKNKPPKEQVYGTLKIDLKLSQCNCNNSSLVSLNSITSKVSRKLESLRSLTEQTKVIVRVYLVQGLGFRSHDAHSQSDSYVKLQLGTHVFSDRAHYIPNQSNPIFGKRVQMEAVIPREHILQISVFDRGGIHDDLIGSTFIDLEDRIRSRHRATVGIANEFNRTGYNMWRDALTPYEILRDLCKKYNLGTPVFKQNTVEVGGMTFEDETVISTDEDLQERLSLSVLKNIKYLPSIGFTLVPEHVETRSLYRQDRPGVEQGKFQLWIEIFDPLNVPPPIDITPIPARVYELRIIVWSCSDVVFNEKNVFGTKMSDIYIKGWCEDSEESQETDVHYRSLTGEGYFNWRMKFPIKYSIVEDMMVIKQKSGLLEQSETKQPPMLYVQIWENDAFSSDDFMGAMEICLSNFPQPFESKKSCTESQIRKKRKSINLFREKSVKGWFPCKGPTEKGDFVGIAGKLELELEILSESEAAANPAGLGRNPPNGLPTPERPETSFNPLTNPLKAVKLILVPALKKYVCYCVLLLGVFLLLMVLLQDLPHQGIILMKAMFQNIF